MTAWSEDELRRIGEAQELQIAPLRRNGELRGRTTIWAVRAGEDVYVRAAYGPGTGWRRVARTSHQGRVWAGGVEKDVAIEDADRSVWDDVDAAYRAKYGHYASIVDGITNDDARATTLRLVPRS
jgi:hypothetical protein